MDLTTLEEQPPFVLSTMQARLGQVLYLLLLQDLTQYLLYSGLAHPPAETTYLQYIAGHRSFPGAEKDEMHTIKC